MRLTVTHYRILILAVNFLLGLGVPAFAAYRYWLTTAPTPGGEIVTDISKFVPRDDGALPAGPDSSAKLRIVDTWLQPRPPKPPDDLDKKKLPGEEASKGSEATKPGDELLPGKLGDEGWTYIPQILRDNPMKNLVVLRKKDPVNASLAASGAAAATKGANPRARTTAKPAARTSKVGKLAQQSGDHVSFRVEERRYTNEELGLDFFIDSADAHQFVYWLPDTGFEKKFALKYQSESRYTMNPEEGLRPAPKPAEETEAPEKPKPFIIRDSKTFEPKREQEYQDLISGKVSIEATSGPSEGGLRTLKPSGPTVTPITPALKTPGAHGASSAKIPSIGDGARRGVSRPPTAAESKQLKEAINAIPADAQKELMEGLQKGGMGAPK